MNRFPRFLVLIACTALTTYAQSTGDRWRDDLNVVLTQLPRVHPDPFTRISRAEFEDAAARISANLDSMTNHEIVVSFARLIAMLGDAHTNLLLTQPAAGFRQLPIRLRWFDEGLFVTHAGPAYARAIGRRVIRIEDLPVEEAFERAKTLISYENESWARELSQGYLTTPEVLHALRVISEPAHSVSFVLEGLEDKIQVTAGGDATLPHHLARPGNPRYQLNPALNYWFDYLSDSRTLYMKYNRCQEAPGLVFAEFFRVIADFGQANRVERFILDLRNNTGGDTEVLRPLILALDEAIRAGAIRAGDVRVILGRQTFSAAMRNAIDLKRLGAVLFGEPTGGRPNAFGNAQTLTLPNSRLVVSVSTRLFTVPDVVTSALYPDVPLSLTAPDYFADRDPFLEAALANR